MMPRRTSGVAQAPPPARVATLDEKLDYVMLALHRLVEISEQLVGQVPIVLEPQIVPGLVSIPLDPEVLNRAIQAMGLKGRTSQPTLQHPFSCPAGVTTQYPLGLPTGYYCTCCLCTISSDFYDANITVNVYVDDDRVTPWGVPLTRASTLCYGQYHVKKRLVLYEVINNTAFDALITVALEPICLIEKSYYDEFYAPIVGYMYSALEGVARG